MNKPFVLGIVLCLQCSVVYAGFTPSQVGGTNGNLSAQSDTRIITCGTYPLSVNLSHYALKYYSTQITISKLVNGSWSSRSIFVGTGACSDSTLAPYSYSVGNLWNDSSANGSYKLTVYSCQGGCLTGYCNQDIAASLNDWSVSASASSFPLTVNRAGNGGGYITSDPNGISCGTICSWGFSKCGPTVTLTASPDAYSDFSGWSGSCTSSPCTLTMDAAKNVIATFTLKQKTLTVSKVGNGTVVSSPASIDCGNTCVTNFNINSQVALTALPNPGNIFTGWSGACTGKEICTVLMDADKSVTANFIPDISAIINMLLFD